MNIPAMRSTIGMAGARLTENIVEARAEALRLFHCALVVISRDEEIARAANRDFAMSRVEITGTRT
eukprot:4817926-Pleurochrysis_carterae.AAC.1